MRSSQLITHRTTPLHRRYWQCRYLFLMFLPAIAYYVVFKYLPIYGVQIAFKDYSIRKGILGSDWVGLKHFITMFKKPSFFRVFSNTFILSGLNLAFGFPAPIILALLLNEVRGGVFKKFVQTVSYLPHFLSWVMLSGIFIQLLSPSIGPIGELFRMLGWEPVLFMGDSRYFRGTLVVTGIWKGVGWGSIIYLASIAGIDQEQYEAATVDGANRFQKIVHITLPGIMPVICMQLIFAVGGLAGSNFDQVYNMYSPVVYDVADVIGTYTYREGIGGMKYSYTAAVGLFQNTISIILIVTSNMLVKRVNEYGIW